MLRSVGFFFKYGTTKKRLPHAIKRLPINSAGTRGWLQPSQPFSDPKVLKWQRGVKAPHREDYYDEDDDYDDQPYQTQPHSQAQTPAPYQPPQPIYNSENQAPVRRYHAGGTEVPRPHSTAGRRPGVLAPLQASAAPQHSAPPLAYTHPSSFQLAHHGNVAQAHQRIPPGAQEVTITVPASAGFAMDKRTLKERKAYEKYCQSIGLHPDQADQLPEVVRAWYAHKDASKGRKHKTKQRPRSVERPGAPPEPPRRRSATRRTHSRPPRPSRERARSMVTVVPMPDVA